MSLQMLGRWGAELRTGSLETLVRILRGYKINEIDKARNGTNTTPPQSQKMEPPAASEDESPI